MSCMMKYSRKSPTVETYLFTGAGNPVLHSEYKSGKNWRKKTWHLKPGTYYTRQGSTWEKVTITPELTFIQTQISKEEVPKTVREAAGQ